MGTLLLLVILASLELDRPGAVQEPVPGESLEEPTWAELRASLDALRGWPLGAPAPSREALAHLPWLIRSRSGWWVGGAAYIAGRHGRVECVPALLEALAHENRRDPRLSALAKSAILDALLQLDAEVPAALLVERLDEECLSETYLLLARDLEANAAALTQLFDAAPREAGARWAAACALTQRRDPGVAAGLLDGLELHDFVVVWGAAGPPEAIGMEHRGAMGGSFGSSHELWPPRVLYQLQLPGPDAPLLPIPFTRSERARSGPTPPGVHAYAQTELALRLLGELLESEAALLPRAYPGLGLTWEGPALLRAELEAHFAAVRLDLARACTALERRGLLEDAAAAVETVRIRLHLNDERSERGFPLPELARRPWLVVELE